MLGSACALGLNIVYHKRQIARKAGNKYTAVPSTAAGDVEMGPEPIATGEHDDSGIVEGDLGTAK